MISETYYDAFTSWRYDAAADRWDEAAKVTSRGLYDSAFGYQVQGDSGGLGPGSG